MEFFSMAKESETASPRTREQRNSVVRNHYTPENALTAINLLANAAEHWTAQLPQYREQGQEADKVEIDLHSPILNEFVEAGGLQYIHAATSFSLMGVLTI